jgi:hypothetical protein
MAKRNSIGIESKYITMYGRKRVGFEERRQVVGIDPFPRFCVIIPASFRSLPSLLYYGLSFSWALSVQWFQLSRGFKFPWRLASRFNLSKVLSSFSTVLTLLALLSPDHQGRA